MYPHPKPSHKTNPRRRKQIWQWVKKVLTAILALLRLLVGLLTRVFLGLISQLSKVQRRNQILAIILLLIWTAIILGYFIFQGSYTFEGYLLVEEMSFTYTGGQNKRFLNTIRDIKNLDLEGSQPQSLVLTGKFSSDLDPQLNEKLSQLKQLTIELPYPKSRLIFTPTNPTQTNAISILKFSINPESQVNQLNYNSQPSQLSFCLQSAREKLESCLFPDSLLDNYLPSQAATVGSLELQLGQQPITVSLTMFNLPELGIQSDIYDLQELSFQFIPEIDELQLTTLSPTRLLIDLPNLSKTGNSQTEKPPQWFWGDIDVKDVSFSKFEITENVNDELKTSTIISGEVRMKNKTLKLQENQFLIVFSDKPGIRKLRYIQIKTKPTQGLQTLISGESEGIAVGLYPEFPVESIKPSWLSKNLSQEGINALLAFIAALTGVLLPSLFPETPKQP
ncbi:MAG: hypothetical protein F6K36_13655 [Symploca sp. SIO3C6]|nr:hypothetical protein [Symploca sp. SIO3C6]